MLRELSDVELDCVSGGGGTEANTRRCKPKPPKCKHKPKRCKKKNHDNNPT